MEIENETIHNFCDATLTEIGRQDLPQHTRPCPHCGLPVMYPTIARAQDIKDFQMIMNSAARVMEKYGITANLLAEIRADCLTALARQRSKEDDSYNPASGS
ncbi:MAG TPA: hypothetical protein VFL54_04510 [Gammaproteobacteria bacterium]|nr:hypothetical protein [Gammaproteobacteria bacterium]